MVKLRDKPSFQARKLACSNDLKRKLNFGIFTLLYFIFNNCDRHKKKWLFFFDAGGY